MVEQHERHGSTRSNAVVTEQIRNGRRCNVIAVTECNLERESPDATLESYGLDDLRFVTDSPFPTNYPLPPHVANDEMTAQQPPPRVITEYDFIEAYGSVIEAPQANGDDTASSDSSASCGIPVKDPLFWLFCCFCWCPLCVYLCADSNNSVHDDVTCECICFRCVVPFITKLTCAVLESL